MSGVRDLYQGYALQAVDKKGRLAIPARLRDSLLRNSIERTLIIGDNVELPCMAAYDEPYAMLLKQQMEADHANALAKGEAIARSRDELNRFGNVDEVQFDDAGRFILPSFVMDDLGLTDFAYFAGAGNYFNIWNPRRLIADTQQSEGVRKRCAFALKEKGVAL